MAKSPLLQIPQVAPSQTNKETTINDGFSILERSLNDIKGISLAAGNEELNLDDYTRAFLFELRGHTVARTLTVPASTRLFSVFNAGASNVTIRAKDTGGVEAIIPPASYCVLFNNGSDIRMISDSAASGQVSAFLSLPDTPNSFAGQAGRALVVNANEDGMDFGTIAVRFRDLTDAPNSYTGQAGRLVRVNAAANGVEFATDVRRFVQLTDAPNSYESQAGRMVVVNALENGVTFQDIPEAVIQATRDFDLPNAGFDLGNFDNWITPQTSGDQWHIGTNYGPFFPTSGSYLAYFPIGQGNEPSALGYEVDLTERAYPEELDNDAQISVELTVGSIGGHLCTMTIDFYDEDDLYMLTATSPSYVGTSTFTVRRFKTDVPEGARRAVIYATASINPEAEELENLDMALDTLHVSLKFAVDQIVNFKQLFDVPHGYEGQSGRMLVVNASESGLEYADAPPVISRFTNLTDTPSTYTGATGRFLRVNSAGSAVEFTIPTFLQMGDTPATYAGHAGKVARVNSSENALVFNDYRLGTLSDVDFTTPPAQGQTLVYDSQAAKFKPGTAGGGSANYPPFAGNSGKVLAVNSAEDNVEWVDQTGGGGANYPPFAGNAGKVLAVNSAETGVQWATAAGGIPVDAFGVSFSTTGTPDPEALLSRFLSPGTFALPVDLEGSSAYCTAAPVGGDVVFTIARNGASVGNLTFADGSQTGAFTFASSVGFAAGDRLEVFAPAVLRGIEDVTITFIGEV